MFDFAEQLRLWRKRNNLTRKEAGDALGLSWRTVEGYEQRRHKPHGLVLDGLRARMEKSEKQAA